MKEAVKNIGPVVLSVCVLFWSAYVSNIPHRDRSFWHIVPWLMHLPVVFEWHLCLVLVESNRKNYALYGLLHYPVAIMVWARCFVWLK